MDHRVRARVLVLHAVLILHYCCCFIAPLHMRVLLTHVPYLPAHTTPQHCYSIGGYHSGDPASPSFQQMIVRWFQFGAFCPLFRLHGHRAGGPPADTCGPTNGDNEVWNLAPQQSHYDAIADVMALRESLRGYVADINNVSVATGLPMMRSMALAFPRDPVAAADQAEAQYMFGPAWLVAPVTAENATTWPVYLPAQQWDSVAQGPPSRGKWGGTCTRGTDARPCPTVHAAKATTTRTLLRHQHGHGKATVAYAWR